MIAPSTYFEDAKEVLRQIPARSLGYSMMVISKDFPYPGARISRLRPTTTSGRMKPTAVRERARFFYGACERALFAGDFNEAIERGRNKKVSQKKLILYPDHIFRSQLQLRMINLPEQPTLNAGILQALGRILCLAPTFLNRNTAV